MKEGLEALNVILDKVLAYYPSRKKRKEKVVPAKKINAKRRSGK